MSAVTNPDTDALDNFVNFLFEGLDGYAYLAAKPPGTTQWLQEFFHFPSQTEQLKSAIKGASATHEIYLAPVLYTDAVLKSKHPAERENFKATNVVWTEFDGNAPDWSDFDGPPSLIIQSSGKGHHHVYWRLVEPLTDSLHVEDINRRIVYNFQADNSAWDITQVLRPPLTTNHKRGTQVRVINESGYKYDPALFDSLTPAPKPEDPIEWELSEVPTAQEVIQKYEFPPDLKALLAKPKHDISDRSAALMQLAYGCCQMQMQDNEVFAMLLAFDDLLGKFVKRNDRHKRLAQIVSIARQKHPLQDVNPETSDNNIFVFDYKSFLATEIEIDWAIEGMLMEGGNMLMAGPSGIGKTQLTLQFMKHVALGKDFLHYKIPQPKKVLFLSLEMGHAELQIFMQKQDADLTEPERDLLARNFNIIALGEPWPLNKSEGQNRLMEVLDEFQPNGLFVDSIGASVLGNINSSDVVQPFVNFNYRIRSKYNCFLWYIHHTRKAQQGGQGVTSQDDIYGDQYLNNSATSSYLVLPAKEGNIRLRNTKNRLAPKENDYLIERTANLNFRKVNAEVDEFLTNQLNTSDGPTAGTSNQFDL